jgi:hypothetical protein
MVITTIAIRIAFSPKNIKLRSLYIEPIIREDTPSSSVMKAINVKNAYRKVQPSIVTIKCHFPTQLSANSRVKDIKKCQKENNH